VASVWIPSRVSESKGDASEYREDRVKVVVIAGVVVDGGATVQYNIRNIAPVFCKHLSIWFQSL